MFFTSIVFFASTLFSVLPPLVQSSRELQEILSDPRFFERLGSAALLKEISVVEKGYLFITRDQILQVDIQYQRSTRPGPVSFTLHFHEPTPILKSS